MWDLNSFSQTLHLSGGPFCVPNPGQATQGAGGRSRQSLSGNLVEQTPDPGQHEEHSQEWATVGVGGATE